MQKKVYLQKPYLAMTISGFNGTELVFDLQCAPAAMDFLRFHPDSNRAEDMRQQLRVFVDEYLVPACRTSEFGRLGQIGEKGAALQHFLSHRYHNTTLLAAAQVLARCARLFDEPRYLRYAEHQMHWLLGKNYFDMCFLAGVGGKLMATRTSLAGLDGRHQDGIIPGGMMKGYGYAEDPFGFPLIHGVHVPYRDGYRAAGQEYWKIFGGYWIMAAQEIAKSLQEFSE